MNIKKYAAITAAAAAVMAVTAVLAGAETVTKELSYVDSSNVKLSSITYEENADYSKEYSLDNNSKDLLKNAKSGDTLKITYTVSSNGDERYRAGFNFAGIQFYVNSTGTTSINSSFINKNGACHLSGNLSKTQSAEIEYEFELNDEGTVAKVTEAKITADKTLSYKSKLPYEFETGSNIEKFVLNSADRGSDKTVGNLITLSDFKAVLTTTVSETAPTAKWISRSEFTGDQYDGSATALRFSVTPGSNSIDSIKVSKDDKFAEKTGLNLTGSTTYEYGIVVNDIVGYSDITIAIDGEEAAAEEVSE